MLGQRRMSVASSMSEGGLSCWNEEDLNSLSEEQILVVLEEVKKSIKDAQEELALYNRFLSKIHQNAKEPVTNIVETPEKVIPHDTSQDSSSGTVSTSSLDMRPQTETNIRRGSIGARIKLTDREKCWLWQREKESAKFNRKLLQQNYLKDMRQHKVKDRLANYSKEDEKRCLEQLKSLAMQDPILSVRKKKKYEKVESISFENLIQFIESLTRMYLQEQVAAKRKFAFLKSNKSKNLASLKNTTFDSLEVSFVNQIKSFQEIKSAHQMISHSLHLLKTDYNTIFSSLGQKEKLLNKMSNNLKKLNAEIMQTKLDISKIKEKITKIDSLMELELKKDVKIMRFCLVQDDIPSTEDYLCLNKNIHRLKDVIERKETCASKGNSRRRILTH